ncbi:hypothetical protein [Streptomyces sp. NPDC095602]|uniref:hypothetical protein n=1 Tax=Streptomyces sp. NPDC095602 TaxID=3155819 RepID=UPI003327C751
MSALRYSAASSAPAAEVLKAAWSVLAGRDRARRAILSKPAGAHTNGAVRVERCLGGGQLRKSVRRQTSPT